MESFNNKDEIQYLLNEIKQEKPSFLPKIDRDDFNRSLFVKPVMNNNRILKQEGAFILFGIDKNKESPAKVQNLYRESGKQIRLVIPNDSKAKILRELDNLGINKGTLFPEIDKFSNYLKWKYKDNAI